jgi:hypothetical protein
MSTPGEADDEVVKACGEAVVDEIMHLEPDLAGKVLGYAIHHNAIELELSEGDDAVRAFFGALRDEVAKLEVSFEKLAAKTVPDALKDAMGAE